MNDAELEAAIAVVRVELERRIAAQREHMPRSYLRSALLALEDVATFVQKDDETEADA
jgi:hypothetical protein